MIHSIMRQAVFKKFFEKIIPFKDSDKQYDLVEIEKETDKEIQAGSKVKYLAETTWAYKKGKIYVVCGYDREFDA